MCHFRRNQRNPMTRATCRTTMLAVLMVCLSAITALADDPPAATKDKADTQQAEIEKSTKTVVPADLKAEEKNMAKTVAAVKAAQQGAAQNDAMVQQWLQQFRPILQTELTFIRQMCDLAKEQRPKIKAAGEASLLDAAMKFAKSQQPGRVRVGGAVANTQPEPRTIIREGLAQALKETLTPEQMARYTEEATARAAQHKRAAILSVVSRLDGLLCLTAEQREEISTALSSNWQDRWEQWLMMHQYGDQYFPLVPDQHVVAHLNDEQKSVWLALQKIEFGFFGGHFAQQPDDAEWWGDEPAKPEAPAALKALGRLLNGNR